MSTEYSPEYQQSPVETTETTAVLVPAYSSFWPLFILTIALVLWSGFQAWSSYSQNAALAGEFKRVQPAIAPAQNIQTRLYAVAQDLIQTSSKDANAAQIVKEADIHYRPGATPSTTGK